MACAKILSLCVGNRWVNSTDLEALPIPAIGLLAAFLVSSAQMIAKINGALSAKLIRSGQALLLLI